MRACQVQPKNCDRCRYNCSWNISEKDHKKLFTQYWNLNTPERQSDFVCGTTTEYQTRTYLDNDSDKVPKKCQVARKYTFRIEVKTVHLCQGFYLVTLDIGSTYVSNCLKHE